MSDIVVSTRILNGTYLDDGYAFIGAAEKVGLHAVAGWGRDGWDLLDWPIYVAAIGKQGDEFVLLTYCEGDLTLKTFSTQGELYAAVDELAIWHWRQRGESWVKDIPAGEEPDYLKGPFSWKRLDDDFVADAEGRDARFSRTDDDYEDPKQLACHTCSPVRPPRTNEHL